MFRQGDTWRHKDCTDMDVYVVKVEFGCPTYTKLKVKYLNRRAKNLLHADTDTVTIPRTAYHNWRLVDGA